MAFDEPADVEGGEAEGDGSAQEAAVEKDSASAEFVAVEQEVEGAAGCESDDEAFVGPAGDEAEEKPQGACPPSHRLLIGRGEEAVVDEHDDGYKQVVACSAHPHDGLEEAGDDKPQQGGGDGHEGKAARAVVADGAGYEPA